MKERIVTPIKKREDLEVEESLRPQSLKEFVGQEKIKENLKIFIEAARNREESLDHVLLYGPPGLGKTTLAHIIANEMKADILSSSGPVLERGGDLAAILTNLGENAVLFIDEIHGLNRIVEEMLYPAMEEYRLDIIIGRGPSARSLKLELPHFTLVGATTRAGLLTSPLRDRFGIVSRLGFYREEDMFQIVKRSTRILKIQIDDPGARVIAHRSRATPRVANRLLRRVRDFAQVKARGIITQEVAEESLTMLEVDSLGLDSMDRQILSTIIDKFHGGPVGLETIAIAVGEETETITDLYEPFLIQMGLLNRTPRGREVSRKARLHLDKLKTQNSKLKTQNLEPQMNTGEHRLF